MQRSKNEALKIVHPPMASDLSNSTPSPRFGGEDFLKTALLPESYHCISVFFTFKWASVTLGFPPRSSLFFSRFHTFPCYLCNISPFFLFCKSIGLREGPPYILAPIQIDGPKMGCNCKMAITLARRGVVMQNDPTL